MFANKLKELRMQHGLTQAQLAKELGIGMSTIGMYESDIRKPSFEVLTRIANYFNVSIDYLISEDTNNNVMKLASIINSLSIEQRKQVESFINFIIHNPPQK